MTGSARTFTSLDVLMVAPIRNVLGTGAETGELVLGVYGSSVITVPALLSSALRAALVLGPTTPHPVSLFVRFCLP